MNVLDIKNPEFLNDLDVSDLESLSADIRQFLIENISITGGHLSSNLGVVELTVALHKVFDSPNDQIFFDVGHQCYVHKILTGRANQFSTLRKTNGLSGFAKYSESVHDVWEAGHASTSLSGALGYATANSYSNNNKVIAVIGDGSIGGGMAFEALNHIGDIGKNIVVILNDNGMSISEPVGGLSASLAKVRYSTKYYNTKKRLGKFLQKFRIGKVILNKLREFKNNFRRKIVKDGKLFEDLGLNYYGPINGHDYDSLIGILEFSKNIEKPIVIHVKTTKGKGYVFAEKDINGKWHGTSPFDIETGVQKGSLPLLHDNWSNIIIRTIEDLAVTNTSIAVITPAMENGSMLSKFKKKYPNRYFDVGIAEEHAVTFAAGLALGGMKPIISIYSTFLQRGYDQILHDVSRMNTNVILCVDRSGLVGADGETHHGIYDVAYLKTIPNMVICMPRNAVDAQHLLNTCVKYSGPIAIRYPRGSALYEAVKAYKEYEIGEWEELVTSSKKCIITYGNHVDSIYEYVFERNIDIGIVNARFILPIDIKLIKELFNKYEEIYVYEEVVASNSLYTDLIKFKHENGYTCNITSFSLPDEFIPHGNVDDLLAKYELDYDTVFKKIG